jgi:CHAD domain-containing protein
MTRRIRRSLRQSRVERAEGARRIEAALHGQQRQLGATALRAVTGDGAAVHDSRVAARRLRSLLKTLRPLLDDQQSRRMRAELREFASSLGAVREADVRRDLLTALIEGEPALTRVERRRLDTRLGETRQAASDELRLLAAAPAWERRLRSLQSAAALGRLRIRRDTTLASLLARVDDSWKPAVRLMKREPTEAAELHDLRLSLKHCRYALEPVADLEPAAARRLLRRLRAAQDRIGDHRDTVLAEQWVAANAPLLGEPLADRLQRLLQRRARRLRRQAASRARKVLPAYAEWRKATRALRTERRTGPP